MRYHRRSPLRASVLYLAGLLCPFLPAVAGAAEITGAGSSFAGPVYQAWGDGAKAAGVFLNYQSIGSSAGQNLVAARTVDFGASDAPMKPERLAASHLFQFPTVTGGIVPVVNLPGIGNNTLRLSGPVLAALFDGRISSWRDPRVAALNPGLELPDLPVASVHRADGSGTTFVFTSYLSRVSPEFRDAVGAASSVAWSAGAGARGNDGIGATIRTTVGSIGYVEYSYALNNAIPMVLLQNHDGAFVAAGSASFSAAAARADWAHASHFAADLLDSSGQDVWPVVSATFVLVPDNPADTERAAAVRKFFEYAFANGDKAAVRLSYIPLPEGLRRDILAAWPGGR
ncbi:phosphate ABC transporter substrate-binding protein PstS [Acetobacter sp. AN02]|uniref:phosphate ABC transporter substrate-binding protein PstS n=1 Tax=Acetobacter sp. AN02 TaxID=2894186 RepID=UPI0024341DB2|nr:phosphate ABC transporter substrate-binding protein PstS [Acetobacter sp. AN02]MDG6094775.1 phosphate ABC transporter substrate-binding protein PstS [Acetobacter sp. AN02]